MLVILSSAHYLHWLGTVGLVAVQHLGPAHLHLHLIFRPR